MQTAVIMNDVYFLFVTSQEFIPGYLYFSYYFYFHFCKQEMPYCSDDAPRTVERNVNLNKNTSENVASNKIMKLLWFIIIIMKHFKNV